MSTMSALAMLGLILVVLVTYWLPSILAFSWRHPDLVPIVLVNGLLGWTVLGWVRALYMLVRPGAELQRLPGDPASGSTLAPDSGPGASAR